MIKEILRELICGALDSTQDKLGKRLEKVPEIELERPKEKDHGDWSTNIALVLSGKFRMSPVELGEAIVDSLDNRQHFLEKVEVAKPGFINFFLSNDWFYEVLRDIDKYQEHYGKVMMEKRNIQIEFVSANPVGPMHVGHGRWAAVGDVLANLFKFCGCQVTSEFYINDYGSQMNVFAESVAARYLQELGQEVAFPDNGYKGDYVREIAAEIVKDDGDKYLRLSRKDREETFKQIAYEQVMEHLKVVLQKMGVVFDVWFSEAGLHRSGAVESVVRELDSKGFVYKEDGAVWLRTSDFGDDKDRVLIRDNGEPTYFAADIAYHKNKFQRGFQELIDIWGADHHGYVKRVKAAMQALGFEPESLRIIIGQLVNLLRNGEPVRMSKRTGEMITLEELLDEVGKDAARYFFLTRSTDSSVDFDIEVAKTKSNENPVYYVQYAHARISSILRLAEEQGIRDVRADDNGLELLETEWELLLIRKLEQFSEILEKAINNYAPYLITKYVEEVAAAFHVFYTQCRVITDDPELSMARLLLCKSTQRVLKNALGLLGVTAPERM
jgi:arginyl-tRNA synthetase